MKNRMEFRFLSLAENEALARMVISAFLMSMNPTISLISEVRTAVSEAVTNAIVHGYEHQSGEITMRAQIADGRLELEIEDFGRGIDDVKQAMQPFFTTKPEQERTGIGFALMQSFMDEVHVRSTVGKGTLVQMRKLLRDDLHDGE